MSALRLLLTVIVAIVLFVGGIFLLSSHLPFWSIYFGVPSVQVGIILLIFCFERLSKESVEENLLETMKLLRSKANKQEN